MDLDREKGIFWVFIYDPNDDLIEEPKRIIGREKAYSYGETKCHNLGEGYWCHIKVD